MARKNVLEPVLIASAQSLGASFNSTPTLIDFMDNTAYQINVTTSSAVGTFDVQGSLDYFPGNANQAAVTGNWVNLGVSPVPTLASANDTILININQAPFRALRVSYTRTSGTGTCNIYIMSKQLGG